MNKLWYILIVVVFILLTLLAHTAIGRYQYSQGQAHPVRCSDFYTQPQAQEFFEKYHANYLDRNKDNIACNNLHP